MNSILTHKDGRSCFWCTTDETAYGPVFPCRQAAFAFANWLTGEDFWAECEEPHWWVYLAQLEPRVEDPRIPDDQQLRCLYERFQQAVRAGSGRDFRIAFGG